MKNFFSLLLGFFACFYSGNLVSQNQKLIDSLELVVNSPVEDTIKVIALGELSWEYHLFDKEKALNYALEELDLAQKRGFLKGIGLGYMDMGVTYSYHGDYLKAIDHYQRASPYFEKAKKPFLQALMHYNTAVAYNKFEASDKAIAYFLQAIDLLEEQEDWSNVSQSYTGIANSYATLRQFPKAIMYHKKAIQIAENHSDFEMLAVGITDFSATYNAMYEAFRDEIYLDSALHCLNQVNALLDAGKVENPIMRPSVLHNIGNNFFQQGDYEAAIPFILEALSLAEPVHLQSAVCQGNIILARIYTSRNQFALAESHLKIALPIALETNPFFAADLYEAYFEWALAQQKFEDAISFKNKWSQLMDSIYNIETAEMANRLELQYETEKKQARITTLEQQNEYEKRKSRFYVALIIAALLLSALILYLLKLKQRLFAQKEKLLNEECEKAQLQQELTEKQHEKLKVEFRHQEVVNELQEVQFRKEIQYKERELFTNVVLLEQHNAFLKTIKSELQVIMPKANGQEEALKAVNKLIDKQVAVEQDFGNFVIHFEKVHPEFFFRLNAFAPTVLTLTEQKLSAYIRMKLSTKEIAQLLNVAPKSIQMARYRLKQKLKLFEETDLVSFLQEL